MSARNVLWTLGLAAVLVGAGGCREALRCRPDVPSDCPDGYVCGAQQLCVAMAVKGSSSSGGASSGTSSSTEASSASATSSSGGGSSSGGALPGELRLLSFTPDGGPGDDDSTAPQVSSDGRYVVFESAASNLAATAGACRQVYLYDVEAGTLSLVSQTPDGGAGAGCSGAPSIGVRQDHPVVAFESTATDLHPADTNNRKDVFVRDVDLQRTLHISATPSGDPADDESTEPSISPDGEQVAFTSQASDVVPGLPGSPVRSIYATEVTTPVAIRLVARGDGTSRAPVMDRLGNVLFLSSATNLTNGGPAAQTLAYLASPDGGIARLAPAGASPSHATTRADLAPDDGWAALETRARFDPAETGDDQDIYLRAPDGGFIRANAEDNFDAEPTVGNGGVVAFTSGARLDPADTDDVRDVYLRHADGGLVFVTGHRPGLAAGARQAPSISADGKVIAFQVADNINPVQVYLIILP